MATILPFMRDQSVFDPNDIAAMSAALDDIALKLELGDDILARATIATLGAQGACAVLLAHGRRLIRC